MNPTKRTSSPRRVASLFTALSMAVSLTTVPAGAEMCVIDQVPAATLLVPYFELPLDDSSREVLLTVHNATPQATGMHVTFWSDWGVPTLDFDIFLTGYDEQTMSLYEMFTPGNLPITADEQSDPSDEISPHGDPSWDGDIDECQNYFPWYINPLITGALYSRIREGHTGQPVTSVGGGCFGSRSPGLARGYITFDVARACSTQFPSDSGYFEGFDQIAIPENRIFGEVSFVHRDGPDLLEAHTLSMVHIEADPSFDSSSTASGATFYGRYSEFGNDHREPLGASWAAPVHNNQTVTSLLAWRDPQGPEHDPAGYACGVGPDWLPINNPAITCWDDQENVIQICQLGNCLVNETQRVAVDDLSLPWTEGWCQVDLSSTTAAPYQSWLGVVHAPAGGGGAVSALQGLSLSAACDQPAPP